MNNQLNVSGLVTPFTQAAPNPQVSGSRRAAGGTVAKMLQ